MGLGVAGTLGALGASVSAGSSIASAVGGGSTQSGDVSSGLSSANAAEQQAYSDYSGNAQPFISTGTNALSAASDAAGLNGASGYADALSSFQASPGFAYDEQQGLSAIDNGAASTGTLRTGNTVRAEEGLGENLANQDFSNYYNRLSGLATQGMTATNSLGQAGLTSASAVASADTSAATAQANIAGNTSKSVGNALSGLAGNTSVQNALSGLGSSGVTSGAGNGSNVGVANTSLPQAPANILG